jgi:isopentenyl-diphosphate Delta-isomerase
LREEIGLNLSTPPERLFKLDACAETDAEFVWVYRCHNDGPFQLQPEEIETGGWFTLEHVSRWIKEKPPDFAPAFVFIWNKHVRA